LSGKNVGVPRGRKKRRKNGNGRLSRKRTGNSLGKVISLTGPKTMGMGRREGKFEQVGRRKMKTCGERRSKNSLTGWKMGGISEALKRQTTDASQFPGNGHQKNREKTGTREGEDDKKKIWANLKSGKKHVGAPIKKV